jgi:hypothetical protein
MSTPKRSRACTHGHRPARLRPATRFSTRNVNEVDKVDRTEKAGNQAGKWGWLPQHMPGVAKALARAREAHGADWVAHCWQQGVVACQPGWFYAAEGPIAVGTPWPDDPQIAALAACRITPTQVLLVLRPKEAADGAH